MCPLLCVASVPVRLVVSRGDGVRIDAIDSDVCSRVTPPSGRQIYYNPYLDRRVFGFGFRARLKSLLARPLADFEGTCNAPPFK